MLGLLVAAACTQDQQTLPFESSDQPTTRTIGTAGGSISTPAGASVTFPSGALAGGTGVTLTPAAVPAAALQLGTAASGGFALDPAGQALAQPAEAMLRFDAGADRSWLATLVDVTPDSVIVVAKTDLNLTSALASAPIERLGTLAVVIPGTAYAYEIPGFGSAAASVAPAAAAGPSLSSSVSIGCGSETLALCPGFSAEASANLRSYVARAALIFPRVGGAFQLGLLGEATGAVSARSDVRVLLTSHATAINVGVHARLETTAASTYTESSTQITLTNVHFVMEGFAGDQNGRVDDVRTVTVQKSGAGAGTLTVTRTFNITNSAGQLEPATVSIAFPVQIS